MKKKLLMDRFDLSMKKFKRIKNKLAYFLYFLIIIFFARKKAKCSFYDFINLSLVFL